MEKKIVTSGNPVTAAGITVVPISKITINVRRGKWGIAFSGSKQPDSVIITTPSARRAFRITGEEVTLDQLVQEFPDILKKLE